MKRKTASVLMALLMLINASSISVFAASHSTSASSKAAISSGQIPEKQVISIIPLDSRPCHTQYPLLIGGILNQPVLLPPS